MRMLPGWMGALAAFLGAPMDHAGGISASPGQHHWIDRRKKRQPHRSHWGDVKRKAKNKARRRRLRAG